MAGDAGDPEALLAQALDNLNKAWMRASSGWQDKAKVEFEKQYIEEFIQSVKRSQHAMRDVIALLRQIRKECSE